MKERSTTKNSRILALDLRGYQLGFAAFEWPSRLIDFGVPRFSSTLLAESRIVCLVEMLRPSEIVVRRVTPDSPRDTLALRTLILTTWLLAGRYSLRLRRFHEKQVLEHFANRGATTKHQVGLVLIEMFPQLAPRLPRIRQLWESENRNMSIFDAVALGVALLERGSQYR